jgi:hypothetical protein
MGIEARPPTPPPSAASGGARLREALEVGVDANRVLLYFLFGEDAVASSTPHMMLASSSSRVGSAP